MKPLVYALMLLTLLVGAVTVHTAVAAQESGLFRCGGDIVDIGDHAFLVFQKCGEPLERLLIGYSLTGRLGRELAVEEWIYGPRAGYYYFITFEGNRVTQILAERER
jgi:hypothetical protein